MKVSVIIPVYNEASNIKDLLKIVEQMSCFECIVVDGGSSDSTLELAKEFNVQILSSRKGRAWQMNAGAAQARGDVLWFLHADSKPKLTAINEISRSINKGFVAGAFKHSFANANCLTSWIAFTGNLRSKLTKIYYGDQGIYVNRDVFKSLGAFPEIEIFEDLILSKRLRKYGKTDLLECKLEVSDRRWRKQGLLKTFFLNQFFYLSFLLGYPPKKLAKLYLDIR